MSNNLRVMVVDDDLLLLKMLRRQVERLGFVCETCSSSEEALEKRQERPYRILLSDWELPGLSGLELCQRVRAEEQYTYVLLLTGTEGPEAKIQALDAGADAFLAKPASSADLRAHLQIAQRILDLQFSLERRLQELEGANRYLVEQVELRQQAEASRDQITRSAREFELRVAAHVQQRLLVSSAPADPFLDIATYNRPSRDVDGDFLDFFRQRSGLDWVVGDVMGKGVPAALLGAGLKTQLLRLLAEHRAGSLDSVITQLNRRTCEDLVSLDSFVTLFYARFDLTTNSLEFVDAGHTKPLVYSSRLGATSELEGPNCPLGFTPFEVYQGGQLVLSRGDRIVFYSDGLTEATNASGDQWGLEAFKASFERSPHGSAKDCLEYILAEHQAFVHDPKESDDLSLIVVQVSDLPEPGALRVSVLPFASDLARLEEIRAFVSEEVSQGSSREAEEMWLSQLQLAVSELASNIIRHAYAGKPGQCLFLMVSLFAEEVVIRLYHSGQPLPLEKLQPLELKSPQESGMGMYITQQVTDRLAVGQERSFHWIEFAKKIP